jgi:hypothetical protein
VVPGTKPVYAAAGTLFKAAPAATSCDRTRPVTGRFSAEDLTGGPDAAVVVLTPDVAERVVDPDVVGDVLDVDPPWEEGDPESPVHPARANEPTTETTTSHAPLDVIVLPVLVSFGDGNGKGMKSPGRSNHRVAVGLGQLSHGLRTVQ